MSNYCSPLRYPGGKNCIFPFISSLIEENHMLGIDYAEPYAGGAGLAIRLLVEGYVNKIYINDLDISIYSFWQTILEHGEDFCNWIETLDINMENWLKYRDVQRDKEFVSPSELAKSTFFLNRTNVSGVLTGGVIGGMNQSGNYKIDARFNKKNLIQRIYKIQRLRDRIVLSNMDGIQFINKMEKKKHPVFFYLDPPYFLKGSTLYMNYYKERDHVNLAQYIGTLNNKWIISYDNHTFIRNLYPQYKMLHYKLHQSITNKQGDELIVFSQKIDCSESLKFLHLA